MQNQLVRLSGKESENSIKSRCQGGVTDVNFCWGEISEGDEKRPQIGLSASEREVLTRLPRALPLEGPKIHQPGAAVGSTVPADLSLSPNPVFIVPFTETSSRDPYVVQGIQLLNYLQHLNQFLIGREFATLPTPPLQLTEPLPVGARAVKPGGLFSGFSGKRPEESKIAITVSSTPKISTEGVRGMLHKGAASISAFVGYDSSTDTALDLLTDVAAKYLQTLCWKLLRTTRDSSLASCGVGQGFSDAMDRTLTEISGQGIGQLTDYYRHSVVNRYHGIVNQCRLTLKECHYKAQLESTYPNMQSSLTGEGFFTSVEASSGMSQSSGLNSCSEAENVPEIHFPSSEERGSTSTSSNTFSLDRLNAPQIETGMQMLQSLEEQASNLDSCSANTPSTGGNSMILDSPASGVRTPSQSIVIPPPGSVLGTGIVFHDDQVSPSSIPEQRTPQQQSAKKRKQI